MNTKNITLLITITFFIFSFSTAKSQVETEGKTLFWEVSGNGLKKKSYLFGTYHLMNNSYLKEIPKAEKAFKKADGVVVETLIDSSKLMSLGMMAMMTETTLDKLLNAEDFDLVSAEVSERLGPQMGMALNMLKPNATMAALIMAYNKEYNAELLGKYTGMPLDLFFAVDAQKRKKQVEGLEALEEQMNILYNKEPLEKQAETLVNLVKDKTDVMKMQVDLATYYLAQDLEQLTVMYNEYNEKYGESDYLLKDRNLKWMDVFPAILSRGNQFIAVGALHLPGEFGMINLLRKAGYTVKPLSAK